MVLAHGVLKRFAARHGINENVDRAPAAYIPLSAACRCASYLPSVPSVLPPEMWTQSGMTGFSRF
jgi:hypothetical protein